jgi:hypothetical protein
VYPGLSPFPSIVTTTMDLHGSTQIFDGMLISLLLDELISLYPLREKMFKAFLRYLFPPSRGEVLFPSL